MASFRTVSDWLDRRLSARAPILQVAAPPLAGGQGVLPFCEPPVRKVAIGCELPGLPLEPSTRPWFTMDPLAVGPSQRCGHRHGWLAAACWRGASDPEAIAPALALLQAWLEADRPGHGPGWVHTTDLTARLIHWLAALAWLGPRADPELRARLAGSAAAHLAQLESRLAPLRPGDPRRSLQLMGLVVGALGWPGLPGASGRAGLGLAALGPALDALLDADGAPRGGALPLLPELLCHGLVLRALCGANRAPLPHAVVVALRRAAALQAAVLAPGGPLEASAGLVEPLLPLEPVPSASVHNACVAAGWVQATPTPGHRALTRALGMAVPGVAAAPWPRELRCFRAAGLVLAHSTIAGRASRLMVRLQASSGFPGGAGSSLGVGWSVGDRAVLVAPHPQRFAPGLGGNVAHIVPAEPPHSARLIRTRLTDRAMVIRAESAGDEGERHARMVELRGHRLEVVDHFEPPRQGLLAPRRAPRLRVGWQLAAGWDPSWQDGALVGRSGDLTLRVELDRALTWSLVRGAPAPGGGWVEGPAGEPQPALLLLGEGPLPERRAIRCGFSLS
jgi:hypothetical protein